MSIELQLLSEQLTQATENSLWCADENVYLLSNINFKGRAITNRYDIHQKLQALKINSIYNNFDFSAVDDQIDSLIYRIAKEKAVNLHIISSAAQILRPQGGLWLLGNKNEGIKSLAKKIQADMLSTVTTDKHKNQWQTLCVQEINNKNPDWLDADYDEAQSLQLGELKFFSQYGIFGWSKIDRGSELLMQCVGKELARRDSNNIADLSVLDLGCGYGYLSIMAKQLGLCHIDATDNNAAAITAARKNFELHEISGTVIADNCAASLTKSYDIILSNPPFHKGFDHHKPISEQFINAIDRLLNKDGQAYIVCNQFIGVEKLCAGLFSDIKLLQHVDGFKVLALTR